MRNLRVNGFGTLGYVTTDSAQPWSLRRDIAQPADIEGRHGFIPDSNLGLQASMQADERLSLVAQVVLRRRAASSSAQESIEWAFASYRLQPDLTLRVGRTSPDLFLFADHRNVGFAYPWARLNQEVYQRMPFLSVDGVDITKGWMRGPVRWEAKTLLSGTSRGVIAANGGNGGDIAFKGRGGLVATVSREEDGLLLKLSVGRARESLDMGSQFQQMREGLRQLSTLPVPGVAQEAAALNAMLPVDDFEARFLGAGLRWERGRWSVHSEITRVTAGLEPIAALAGYVSTGYRIGSVTLSGMLGRAKSPKEVVRDPQWAAALTPLVGPDLAQGAQAAGSGAAKTANAFRIDQRSVAASLRWDMTAQIALKLQWDRMFVKANGSGLWNHATSDPARLDTYSASLNFIF